MFAKNTKKNTDGQITNVICNSAKQGLIPQREYFDKDIANSDNTSGYYIIEENDFVYNPRKSSDAPYGPISSYKYPDAGIVSPLYLCFRAKGAINPSFYEWYFRSSAWHRYVYMSGDSGARHDRVSIKDDVFFAMPISIPSAREQEHIASFLDMIDQRIDKQRALVDNLKKYKRGVMRAIFREKAILFSETTKWKSIRLGDECTFFSGGTPKSTDSSFYGGNIPFIRSGEIHGEKTELFLSDDGLKYSSAKMVSKGDLIVALYGATSGEVDISKIEGAINQAILCIRPTWINRVFLKYLLEDSKDDILNTYLQGGQGNLSAEIIKNLVFDIPDERSQLAVVGFLDIFEQHINSSIELLERLTVLRSGLMQQLFI
ncbi:type I restriction enzyme, S subunit [Oscillibacter sp. PC13]|uniref:restriction endonuclease subunit S n=1 Tax=Oscillibacter sp. PC13 TaxID=1855299 RepID=UPI0008E28670|nr:restriction endonuclease subunit S [Oscillibacter sp. PC13]SFP41818.1 type I restriction enzyme, S subunit [Oscillibacter sp. PC13]